MKTAALVCLSLVAAGTTVAQSIVGNLASLEFWNAAQVPFSFRYDGAESARILPSWRRSQESPSADVHRYIYVDPKTRLRITADVRQYSDFPGTVDWVLRFRNDGEADTPIVEDILPLNLTIHGSDNCIVRHARGSAARANDFEPLEEHLRTGEKDHIESPGGDPSSRNSLPFFNLEAGGGGVILGLGWTGDWKMDVECSKDTKAIAIKSGMKRTHLLLHPGEEIRTPRIVLMSWAGTDWQESQNRWRRLLFAHYTPQESGKPMRGPILFGSWGSEPISSKIAYVNWVHDHHIPVELYAVDAGWYGDSFGGEFDPTNPWWKNRGDWFPSPRYYPNGIRPLGEALKANGLGFSLWIEPETSMPDRDIIKRHPEWFLHSDRSVNPGVALANFGDPAALKGITAMVSRLISEFKMTWYRQDFNIPPERYWELADSPDRIGITEIKHVEGLYKMWDDLLAQHPGLHIDNCASGGRRLDLEMMSRSFVVWRTDHGFADTLAEQAQTQALAPWVPENMGFETYSSSSPWTKPGPYGTPESLYLMRLGYNAAYGVGPGAVGVNNDQWVSWIKQAISEYREVQPYFFGDFYPLLPYSLGVETWTAWQWDIPEEKKGLVLILRRPNSPFTEMALGLKHLKPENRYDVEVRDGLETGSHRRINGSELAHLAIRLQHAPSSTLVFYRQVGP